MEDRSKLRIPGTPVLYQGKLYHVGEPRFKDQGSKISIFNLREGDAREVPPDTLDFAPEYYMEKAGVFYPELFEG